MVSKVFIRRARQHTLQWAIAKTSALSDRSIAKPVAAPSQPIRNWPKGLRKTGRHGFSHALAIAWDAANTLPPFISIGKECSVPFLHSQRPPIASDALSISHQAISKDVLDHLKTTITWPSLSSPTQVVTRLRQYYLYWCRLCR